MKTYIRLKQHKQSTPKKKKKKRKRKTQKQLEPQQTYRIGTISNRKLLGGGWVKVMYSISFMK